MRIHFVSRLGSRDMFIDVLYYNICWVKIINVNVTDHIFNIFGWYLFTLHAMLAFL